jgi:hypothetical protein
MVEQAIVEIELHPRKVELPALLAVQQQLQSANVRLFQIKYFNTQWQSEICYSVERAIERLSELCAAVFMPATSDAYPIESRDLSAVFDDETHYFRPLARKWRVSFGHFDPSVIAIAARHNLLSSLVIVGVKPLDRDPVFRFIGQGHKGVGDDGHVARVGEKVADRADREYGQWLSQFYKFVASSKQPRYDLVTTRLRHAIAGGRSDSPQRTVHYERLLLPWETSSSEVFVTSCSAIVDPPTPSNSSCPG